MLLFRLLETFGCLLVFFLGIFLVAFLVVFLTFFGRSRRKCAHRVLTLGPLD